MKRSLINILILAYLSVGCGMTYQVGGPSGKLSYEEAEDKLIGEEVTVNLANGTKREGTFRGFTPDTLMLQPSGDAQPASIPFSSIKSVSTSPSKSSYFFGGAIGFLIGGLAGCVIGAETVEENAEDVEEGVSYGFTTGLIGGAVGCLAGVGGAASGKKTYEFTQEQAKADSVANEKP